MEVQKVEDVSYAAFRQEFYQPCIPVTFNNAPKDRKAKGFYSPDWFRIGYGVQNFPKYYEATPVYYGVGQGETHLIPFETWHTAYSLPRRISVIFDGLNNKNNKDFVRDAWSFKKKESTVKAIAKTDYSWLPGQACKLDNSPHPQK